MLYFEGFFLEKSLFLVVYSSILCSGCWSILWHKPHRLWFPGIFTRLSISYRLIFYLRVGFSYTNTLCSPRFSLHWPYLRVYIPTIVKSKFLIFLGFKFLYSKLILNFKYFVMRLSHRDLRKLEKRCLYDDCTSRKIVDCWFD